MMYLVLVMIVIAQRRLNKFRKDCIDKGWTHHDDISMGVIYLGGEND